MVAQSHSDPVKQARPVESPGGGPQCEIPQGKCFTPVKYNKDCLTGQAGQGFWTADFGFRIAIAAFYSLNEKTSLSALSSLKTFSSLSYTIPCSAASWRIILNTFSISARSYSLSNLGFNKVKKPPPDKKQQNAYDHR